MTPWPSLGLSTFGWSGGESCVGMLAMLAMWLCGFPEAARTVARAHLVGLAGATRGRFGGEALVAARSAGAAGVTAGEEGSDARSMTLSFKDS